MSGVTLWTTREPFMAAISLLCGICRNMPRLLCDSSLTGLAFVICLTFALNKWEPHRGNFDASPLHL